MTETETGLIPAETWKVDGVCDVHYIRSGSLGIPGVRVMGIGEDLTMSPAEARRLAKALQNAANAC